jgi:hypothetical protein
MQFMETVARSRPTIKQRAKCMEFYAEMKTATQRYFWVQFGTMQLLPKTL